MPENYILTSQGNFMSTDELYHYGVLGMKWGVRKGNYWTETQDKVGGNYTDHQKKRMTRQAKSILNKEIKRSNNIANAYTRDANRAYKKVDKLTWKSEARQNKGDQAGFDKYQSKAWKQVARTITSTKKADAATAQSKLASKRLSEINDGTLKAGRDYVTNKRSSTNLPLSALGIVNWSTEKRIDFRK